MFFFVFCFFCAEFYLNGRSFQLSPFHASQISDPLEEFKAFHIYILIARWMSVYNWPRDRPAVSELCHKAPVRLPQNSEGKANICFCPAQLKAWLANTNQHRTDMHNPSPWNVCTADSCHLCTGDTITIQVQDQRTDSRWKFFERDDWRKRVVIPLTSRQLSFTLSVSVSSPPPVLTPRWETAGNNGGEEASSEKKTDKTKPFGQPGHFVASLQTRKKLFNLSPCCVSIFD